MKLLQALLALNVDPAIAIKVDAVQEAQKKDAWIVRYLRFDETTAAEEAIVDTQAEVIQLVKRGLNGGYNISITMDTD